MTRAPFWTSRKAPGNVVSVEVKPQSVVAESLVVGDIIELPVVQRLKVVEILDASEHTVVVGTKMLIVNTEGKGGVFDQVAGLPIALSQTSIVQLVERSKPQKDSSAIVVLDTPAEQAVK